MLHIITQPQIVNRMMATEESLVHNTLDTTHHHCNMDQLTNYHIPEAVRIQVIQVCLLFLIAINY